MFFQFEICPSSFSVAYRDDAHRLRLLESVDEAVTWLGVIVQTIAWRFIYVCVWDVCAFGPGADDNGGGDYGSRDGSGIHRVTPSEQ